MADTVQLMMERMVPELEELQKTNIFTPDEIRQIVDKRRNFEYMMKRTPLRIIDALRYIEYEINLDALRIKRKQRFGITKSQVSDVAGIKRIYKIFDRVLQRHRGNLNLWLQYIAFCKAQGSSKVLAGVFSKALQSLPRSSELWIEAASYEFSENLNVNSARLLMQRALRINKHSQKLWLEYFRLELLYIQKLTVRREVLQLDEKEEEPQGLVMDMDDLPGDQAEDSDFVLSTKKKARDAVLKGAIPRLIFEEAISSIPEDVSFRLQFVDICDLFSMECASELSKLILQSCLQSFPSNELVLQVWAMRPLIENDNEQGEMSALSRFEQTIKSVDSLSIHEAAAKWLVQRLASENASHMLKSNAKSKLMELLQAASATNVSGQQTVYLASILSKYLDVVVRTDGVSDALSFVQTQLKQSTMMAKSADCWLLYAQLTARSVSPNDRKQVLSVLEEGVKTVDAGDRFKVWRKLLELKSSSPSEGSTKVDSMFQTAMQELERGSEGWNEIRAMYLTWYSTVYPLADVRKCYVKFMQTTQLLPTDATFELLKQCIEMEQAVVRKEDVDVPAVRKLFEKLVDLFGESQEDVWIDYLQFYRSMNMFREATSIYQRARRVWKNSARIADFSLATK